MRTLRLLPLAATLGALALATSVLARAAAPTVDLARYFGRWYVIARTEPGEGAGAYHEYRARPDGDIDAVAYWRDRSFRGAVQAHQRVASADPDEPRRWQVRSGWLSSAEQRILYVSPDYRLALVGGNDGRAGHILARTPEIPEWSYAGLVARLAMQGYDVSRLRRVPHKPEQVGRPGFE